MTMIGNRDEYRKMAEVEGAHWWYQCLHFLVIDRIRKHFGKQATQISIIDAGCGTGGLMKFLTSKGYANIKGFDSSPYSIELCKAFSLNVYPGDIREVDKNHAKKSADVIICNDVLYFFEEMDRIMILNKFHDILKHDGILIMNLPVFQIFSGIHDKAVGIRQRFSREDTGKITGSENFRVVEKIYWPFLLSPLIITARFLQRMKLRFNENTEIKSDVEMPGRLFNALCHMVTRFEFSLLPGSVFGSSLFIILRKIG